MRRLRWLTLGPRVRQHRDNLQADADAAIEIDNRDLRSAHDAPSSTMENLGNAECDVNARREIFENRGMNRAMSLAACR